MGEVKNSNKKGVVLMIGILMVLAVFGSFVDVGTVADSEGFRYLRF